MPGGEGVGGCRAGQGGVGIIGDALGDGRQNVVQGGQPVLAAQPQEQLVALAIGCHEGRHVLDHSGDVEVDLASHRAGPLGDLGGWGIVDNQLGFQAEAFRAQAVQAECAVLGSMILDWRVCGESMWARRSIASWGGPAWSSHWSTSGFRFMVLICVESYMRSA